MLLCEAAAKPYTKASHRRACAAATGKSEGSIEFFFCNISAAREKQGLPIIRGYKARDNYNKALDALVNPTAQQEQTAWTHQTMKLFTATLNSQSGLSTSAHANSLFTGMNGTILMDVTAMQTAAPKGLNPFPQLS